MDKSLEVCLNTQDLCTFVYECSHSHVGTVDSNPIVIWFISMRF